MATVDLTHFKKITIPRPVSQKWEITAEFGRVNPKYWPDFHHGTDFGCPLDTEVYSCLDGIVTRVTYRPRSGVVCSISSWVKDLSQVTLSYCHLRGIFPSEGQKVKAGEKIGISGNTGTLYTGGLIAPHLHLSTQLSTGEWLAPIFKGVA